MNAAHKKGAKIGIDKQNMYKFGMETMQMDEKTEFL